MRKRTVFWRAAAALLVFALLLPAFGSAMATVHPRPKDEDNEPAYDMMAYASYRWIVFNSLDPTQWEVYKEIEYSDPQYDFDYNNSGHTLSAAVRIGDEIYLTAYDNMSETPHYLYRAKEDMVPERLGLLTCEQHNVPHNYDGNGPYYVTIYGLTYAEDQDTLYALAAVVDETEYLIWGIARVDLETYDVEFVCEWTYMGNENFLGLFWPLTIAYAGDGAFYVLEGWSNSIVKLNPETFLEYQTICVLPEMASFFPYGLVEAFMPTSLYYNAEENYILCGVSNASDMNSQLIRVDAGTGEIKYDINLQQSGMPYYPNYWWPLNCFMPYQMTDPVTLGDADGNGSVTVTDALLVMRYAMGIIGELANMEAADVNNSGNIDVTDALLIMRIVMGV